MENKKETEEVGNAFRHVLEPDKLSNDAKKDVKNDTKSEKHVTIDAGPGQNKSDKDKKKLQENNSSTNLPKKQLSIINVKKSASGKTLINDDKKTLQNLITKATNRTKGSGEFDGVFWRTQMKNHFRESSKRWPPKSKVGLFFTKGYYIDWSDKAQKKSKFFNKYLEHVPSEDELTKAENEAYEFAKTAREKGLKEAEEWESYDSEDSGGHVVKKLRRKSLQKRHPDLYTSHAARKAEFKKRAEENKRIAQNPAALYQKPSYSPFIGILHDGQFESVHSHELAEYLKEESLTIISEIQPSNEQLVKSDTVVTTSSTNIEDKVGEKLKEKIHSHPHHHHHHETEKAEQHHSATHGEKHEKNERNSTAKHEKAHGKSKTHK